MSHTYIYDEPLSSMVIDWIGSTLEKYPYVLEMKPAQDLDYLKVLPLYDSEGEDCMGRRYTKKTQMYCMIPKSPFGSYKDGFFLFLSKKQDKDLLMERFPDKIASTNPFKTQFNTGWKIW